MFYQMPKLLTTQEAANRTLSEVSRLLKLVIHGRMTEIVAEQCFCAFRMGMDTSMAESTAAMIAGCCTYPPRCRQSFTESLESIEDRLTELAEAMGGVKGSTISSGPDIGSRVDLDGGFY